MYRRDPHRFARNPSHFVYWSLERLGPAREGDRILELGCGAGRDSRVLDEAGYHVRAVDHSGVAIERALALSRKARRVEFVRADALDALRATPDASVVAVYAHALYMGFPDDELDRLAVEAFRVLRPGGWHCFAVRSTSDVRCGEGVEIAPDTYLGGPHAAPMRYFRRETLARFLAPGFERVGVEHQPELDLWYVADRRPSEGSASSPRSPFET